MPIIKFIMHRVVRYRFRRHVASLSGQRISHQALEVEGAIAEEQVVPFLMQQCSEITPLSVQYLDECEQSPYLDIGVIERYFADCIASAKTSDFAHLFAAAEYVFESGDEDTRNLIAVGFMEGVWFQAEQVGLTINDFDIWLGPKAKQAWIDLKVFWAGVAQSRNDNNRKRKRQK